MSKQSVKFDLNDTIFEIPSNQLEIQENIIENIDEDENINITYEEVKIFQEEDENENENIKSNIEENVEYDTDYEEENEDPKETLKKLLKGRSFGTEEFGRDYESSVELKRKLETTFNMFQKKANTEMFIPDFKKLKDPFMVEEANNIPKIIGKEKDKHLQPCPKCDELMIINYNNCQVCYRETVDVRCLNCFPNLFDLCSPKCREIYEGGISVIEITNDDDETIVIIEDDGENMILKVINHKLFYQELSEKDIKMINKPCLECNPDVQQKANIEESEKENWEKIFEKMDNSNPDDEIEDETIKKIGVIPVKCYNCCENYSYLIVCGTCYSKSGLKYVCDEC